MLALELGIGIEKAGLAIPVSDECLAGTYALVFEEASTEAGGTCGTVNSTRGPFCDEILVRGGTFGLNVRLVSSGVGVCTQF